MSEVVLFISFALFLQSAAPGTDELQMLLEDVYPAVRLATGLVNSFQKTVEDARERLHCRSMGRRALILFSFKSLETQIMSPSKEFLLADVSRS